MQSLLSELRRRQVFRAAAWYGGLAWLAVEIADTVFPQFGLPPWSVRAVIVAAALGMPLALALAWWFDLSPLGLRRESPPPKREAGATPAAALTRAPSFWIALALGIGLAISAQQAWRHLVNPSSRERPGLAVLPFANLSPDPASAWVADGLHEEILATIARAGGLRVISRTSVERYRSPDRDLREIADTLGVSLILEGAVRSDGHRVRLNVQLIDGHTDQHLWSETYDRSFDDALELQRTVALRVVSEMGARLSPDERRLVDRSAPSVPAAYERYLRALATYARQNESPELERLLSEAIELDPDFALALALRSKVRTYLFNSASDADAARLAEGARADFERALLLQPGLPAALVARALYELWIVPDSEGDFESALADLDRALAIAPNDADAHNVAATTLRRLGRIDLALAHLEQASQLMPGPAARVPILQTLLYSGQLAAADRELHSITARYPDERWPALIERFSAFLRTGETAGWPELHERLAPQLDEMSRAHLSWRLLTCIGDLEGLAELRAGRLAAYLPGAIPELDLGLIYAALGDESRAQPLFAKAAAAARKPGDLHRLANTAMVEAAGAMALALTGESTRAIRDADEAVQLLPEARDEINGPSVALSRAWVLIVTKERADEGYAELARVLGAWELWPRWVAARPEWRLLRDDPRVQEIFRAAFARTDESAQRA